MPMLLEKNQVHPKAFMEELTWEQVRNDVIKVNPEFAAVVDKLSPGKEYTVFKATYPYGSEILKKGDLYLPNSSGELVSLKDHSISQHVKDSLDYNLESNPVTLVLKNSVELFLSLEDRTIPFYGLISPGKLFGLWRILSLHVTQQPKFIWDLTAGARSLFMLPKISEANRHNKLKKIFHLNSDTPKTFLDHWAVFKEIANHPDFSEPWFTEVLFFSKNWFQHFNNETWLSLNHNLLRLAWEGSELWRNQFVWDLIFSLIQKRKNIKPNPYAVSTVKHLIAIGVGSLPGFAAAIDNLAAPINGLQKVYTDIYNLKNYAPIIMQPKMFSMYDDNSTPVYYSLQFPSSMEFSPKTRDRSSVITDLYEIRSLFSKYLLGIKDDQLNIQGTLFADLLTNISFDFFHSEGERYFGIKSNNNIQTADPSFNYVMSNFKKEKFPVNNGFMRGVIRIARKS